MPVPSVLDVVVCTSLMAAVAALSALWWRRAWRRAWQRGSHTMADDATFATLHSISRASPALRSGLTRESARRAARDLRAMLGAEAVAVVAARPAPERRGPSVPDGPAAGSPAKGGSAAGSPVKGGAAAGSLLVWDGSGEEPHSAGVLDHVAPVLGGGRARVIPPRSVRCAEHGCRIRVAIAAPLSVEGRVQGVLAAYGPAASPERVRAVTEVARWMSGQLELAELDSSRNRLAEAEMRALRAQISPHFVYNSLTTIASFVRTDPERARHLLLDFADFARYSFRNPRDFTTLADELRSIDRYLLLERARFGDRLHCTVDAAPEVLPVTVPFLSLQPLVENAIRHGMDGAGGPRPFHVRIVARDAGTEAAISVEDDGAGMDPARLLEILASRAGAVRPRAPVREAGPGGAHGGAKAAAGDDAGDDAGTERDSGAGIGLANVDERLRQLYGDDFGLIVETGVGAGTKVSLRVPKNWAGVIGE